MSIKRRSTVWYEDEEHGLEYQFEPVENSLSVKRTAQGWEARYLVRDENYQYEGPEETGDDSLFLVHYHRDYWLTYDKVITEDDARRWYQGQEIEQTAQYWIFPVAAYIHSGVVLSLGDGRHFPDQRWDVSHVGLVLANKECWKTEEAARKAALQHVEYLNQINGGEVYGIVREDYDKDKKQVDHDSVWGYVGYKDALEALKEEV